jgi:hypothetical protein
MAKTWVFICLYSLLSSDQVLVILRLPLKLHRLGVEVSPVHGPGFEIIDTEPFSQSFPSPRITA